LTRTVPRAGPTASPTAGLHARKARALRALGLADEAADEWSEQVRDRTEDRTILAEACDAFLGLQRYDKAIWLTGRILRPLFVQEGQPPIHDYWRCAYPTGFAEPVLQQAGLRGLEPPLVWAVIREESAFAPRAVSYAGARGLMQLMLDTAVQTAREHRLPVPTAAALERPETNIQLGTAHLADLIREQGRLSLALAAYNAGKPAVLRWLARYGFADEVEFIEEIPYTETRNYVKRVLSNYERYRTLYATAPAESLAPRARPTQPDSGE
jgi:soluble lytic murein transglycosylase